MKAIMIVTDSEAVPAFERVLLAEGHQGLHRAARDRSAAAARASRPATASTPASRASSSPSCTEDAARGSGPAGGRAKSGLRRRTRMWSFAVEEAD